MGPDPASARAPDMPSTGPTATRRTMHPDDPEPSPSRRHPHPVAPALAVPGSTRTRPGAQVGSHSVRTPHRVARGLRRVPL